MRRLAAAGFAAGLAGAAPASEPAATPYRPSVSSPAALPTPGYLELEAGWQKAGGKETRSGLPLLLKYAFSEDFGILLGTEAAVSQAEPGASRLRGMGDSTLTLKWRHPLAEEQALGLELGGGAVPRHRREVGRHPGTLRPGEAGNEGNGPGPRRPLL